MGKRKQKIESINQTRCFCWGAKDAMRFKKPDRSFKFYLRGFWETKTILNNNK